MHLFQEKIQPSLEELLAEAQKGNAQAREDLLETNKPFICRVACRYCRKQLQWGQNDELSIALLAFNEAIDKYAEEKKVPFLVFARLIIKHRLVDFFRQVNRFNAISLEEEAWTVVEDRLAREKFNEEIITRERREEIKQYETLLTRYNLDLRELANVTPKHKPVRRQFIKVARLFAGEKSLFESFTQTKKLPLKELEQFSGIPRKTLERHRKYIAALSLIFGYPEEFTYLYSYLKD